MPLVPGPAAPLTAAAYGDQHGVDAAIVVARIRDGTLTGAKHSGVWYVEDAPLPASLQAGQTAAPPAVAARPADPLVVWYESRTYVSILMGLLTVLVAVDLGSFALSRDPRAFRGVGTRVFVLWALWTRHHWVRRGIYLWAGMLAFGAVAGLVVLQISPGGGLAAAGPSLLRFGAMFAAGAFYLATVHRYIRIGPAPDPGEASLEDIGREARLD